MTSIPPILFEWDGEAMIPRYPKIADRHFVIGGRYLLVEHHEASEASRGHYFASLREAWLSLPEDMAEQFPTVEKLRKHALIRSGYRDERSIVCASKAEAQRVAAFMKPMDDYAIVIASEAVVTILTAKSQSQKAMGKDDFQASKSAVLDYVAGMLDVSREVLEKAGSES